MKTLVSLVVLLAQLGCLSAAIITIPNADFSIAGNNGSAQGSIISGGETKSPLGTGPWSAQTTPLASLAPPLATIGSGTAQITGLLGLGAVGLSNSAQFYQTLSGVSYLPNTTYTLSVDLDSSAVLSLNILGTNGIGIALTRGGNTTIVADSNTALPLQLALVPLGGTTYQLSMQYTTGASVSSGDLGIRLYGGIGASGLSVNLLGSVSFDNVSLTTVPEPSAVGLALTGLCLLLAVGRKKALGKSAASIAMLFTVNTHAALLPTDLQLNVTLLPDTKYTVTADLSTDAVSTLLAALNLGDSPLQILDGDGNVLGEIPAQDLIDLLTGATGTVTNQVEMVLQTAGTSVVNPVARVLDDALLQVSDVTVTPTPVIAVSKLPADRLAPTIRINGHKIKGNRLQLKGHATDNAGISHVEVAANGRKRIAAGTSKWKTSVKIHSGRNRIVARAFDASQNVSASKKLIVRMN